MSYLVFCCYAREDKQFLHKMKVHLKPLEREGLITLRADIDISPGVEWEPVLMSDLNRADIILLLISPDFIASDYCFHVEMSRAIKRHELGTACVVPVIVRPATWNHMPFRKLQALPRDAAPLSTALDLDVVLKDVTREIRLMVQSLANGILPRMRPEPQEQSATPEKLAPAGSQERQRRSKDDESKPAIKNKAPVFGQINGGNQEQVIIAQTVNVSNGRKDGISALEAGASALLNGDYSSARRELRIAVQEIDQDKKKEAARAHYLRTLAILGRDHPQDLGVVGLETISELLNAAVNLDPCHAYLMTKAVIANPSIPRQAYRAITSYDTSLFTYMEQCQPDLYRQICQVFGL